MATRIDRRFTSLRQERRAALVPFLTAGDPDYATSLAILCALPAAGADVIELGMPFTDPMADGPAIQSSSQRALKAGQTLSKTLQMVGSFRQQDDATPIVLMGYYNPIYIYGVERFLAEAKVAGVDGLIIVDLDRKSTRLNSSHQIISYAVFCLKKKKKKNINVLQKKKKKKNHK